MQKEGGRDGKRGCRDCERVGRDGTSKKRRSRDSKRRVVWMVRKGEEGVYGLQEEGGMDG